MTPRDMAVFVEGEEGRDARLAFAAALAARWDAYLIAICVITGLELNRTAGFAVGAGLANLLERHRADADRALSETRAIFDKLLQANGLKGELRVSEGEPPAELMLHARHASLAIVGPPTRVTHEVTRLGVSEDVIFASGRPSLLVPPGWPAGRLPRRIVVGWNAGREATRAIADALPFLREAEAVHVVVVPEARVQAPHGAEPGADIARHLARHGVAVELEQHQGTNAGAVLLDRCRRLDADMLVMGAVGRSAMLEFIFGGATRTVLGSAEIPILLSR